MAEPKHHSRKAFTLVEVLAIITIIAVLAGTLLPALAKTKTASTTVQCLANQRQLTAAWRLYSNDFDDWLLTGVPAGNLQNRPVWCNGFLDYSPNPSNWDPRMEIFKSPIFSYAGKNPDLWRCPADLIRIRNAAGQFLPRVRSISMSQTFDFGSWLPVPAWRTFARMPDIVFPNKTFLFIEEHPDSINDAAFGLQMPGPTPAAVHTAKSGTWIDLPGSFHDGACVLSFCDGHAEAKHWQGDKRSTRKLVTRIQGSANTLQANYVNRGFFDLLWLAQRTTVSKFGEAP
jgi:prepilin-type processing-associated H-X9-DG protein